MSLYFIFFQRFRSVADLQRISSNKREAWSVQPIQAGNLNPNVANGAGGLDEVGHVAVCLIFSCISNPNKSNFTDFTTKK